MLRKLVDKASVLIEALPFLQRFRGETVVVKLGGSNMNDPEISESVLTDISFMSCVGLSPVIVHGGGKAISTAMKEQGLEPQFVNGLRVTDEKSIKIVENVLSTVVTPSITDAIRKKGMEAMALSGTQVIRSRKHWIYDPKSGQKLDIGFVGDVVSVAPRPILDLVSQGIIPVISPLGTDTQGSTYNNNADVAAAEVAIAIKARKLVFLSDVHGIMRVPGDEDTFIPTVHSSELETLIEAGVISGGMMPKVCSGIKAIQSGVQKTHIIDGKLKHSLLLELFTEEGIGTEIVG